MKTPRKFGFPIGRNDGGIVISVTCLPEHVPIEGNALASGDDAEDRACEDKIRADLDNGNPWAWCTVQVRATYRGILTGDTYLGCCSYRNEGDFREGGYLEQMIDECIEAINSKLNALCDGPNAWKREGA